MPGIVLTGDWPQARKALRALAGLSMLALHREVGEYLVSATQLRFRHERAPDGKPWPKSIRARAEAGQTLRDTRRLERSIAYKAYPDRVDVGTNVPYAAVHQFGAEIRPRRAKSLRFRVAGRWAMKRKVTIPPRPFLGVSDEDEREIAAIIQKAVEERLR